MLRLNLVWRTSSAHVFGWSFPSFRGTTVLSFVLSSFFSFGCHVIFSLSFTHPSVSYPVVVFGCEIWAIEGFPVSKDPEMVPSLWSSIQMMIWVFVCLFWLHPAARRFLVVQPGIEPVPSEAEVQDPNHWTTRKVSESDHFQQGCGPSYHPLSAHHHPSISTPALPAFSGLSFRFPPTRVPSECILRPSRLRKASLSASPGDINLQLLWWVFHNSCENPAVSHSSHALLPSLCSWAVLCTCVSTASLPRCSEVHATQGVQPRALQQPRGGGIERVEQLKGEVI